MFHLLLSNSDAGKSAALSLTKNEMGNDDFFWTKACSATESIRNEILYDTANPTWLSALGVRKINSEAVSVSFERLENLQLFIS